MNISLCQTSSYQTNSNFLLSRDVLRAVHSEPRILRITIAIADNFTISALLKVQDRCQIIGSLFLKIQNTEYKFRMHSVASCFDFYLYFGDICSCICYVTIKKSVDMYKEYRTIFNKNVFLLQNTLPAN